MSLIAVLPGIELYTAIHSVGDRGYSDARDNPIIYNDTIVFEGANAIWNGKDALVVVMEINYRFDVITRNVTIIRNGTLYYPLAADIFHYLSTNRLTECEIVLNSHGIFATGSQNPYQLPFEGPGFNNLFPIDDPAPTFLLEAKRELFLKPRMKELDKSHKDNPPSSREEESLRYERDAVLVKLLKEIRGPKCQICSHTFMTRSGEYFCECHHLESLASGGLDVSQNMLILCANCHRRFHFGNVLILSHKEDKLVVEMDGIVYECNL